MNKNSIIVIYNNHNFSSVIKYVFDLIFSVYGIEYQTIPMNIIKKNDLAFKDAFVISYGKNKLSTNAKYQIHIYASDFLGKNYLKPSSMPKTPLKKYGDLPIIYYSDFSDLNGVLKKSNNSIETSIDIIASIFFMLSRYEEITLKNEDRYNRFPGEESLAGREGFLHRPIVNEYIELLWEWIQQLNPNLKRKPLWPGEKEFAVCVTHDIDYVKKYKFNKVMRRLGRLIFIERKFKSTLDYFYDYLKVVSKFKKEPFDNFEDMLECEQKYEIMSSFYFMTDGDSPFDSDYKINNVKVMNRIKMIQERGCEVGLHPSFNSYLNYNMLKSQKIKLDNVVKNNNYGCRQHYLRWKTPDTWRILEKAGFLYDSSMGFADHEGFRCGFCLPFKPYDVIENRVINVWELPFAIMDGTLCEPNYRNLSFQQCQDLILEYIEKTKEIKGALVFIFHNTFFDRFIRWKDVFEEVIAHIGSQNVFCRSGREIIEWWEKRKSFPLS